MLYPTKNRIAEERAEAMPRANTVSWIRRMGRATGMTVRRVMMKHPRELRAIDLRFLDIPSASSVLQSRILSHIMRSSSGNRASSGVPPKAFSRYSTASSRSPLPRAASITLA